RPRIERDAVRAAAFAKRGEAERVPPRRERHLRLRLGEVDARERPDVRGGPRDRIDGAFDVTQEARGDLAGMGRGRRAGVRVAAGRSGAIAQEVEEGGDDLVVAR